MLTILGSMSKIMKKHFETGYRIAKATDAYEVMSHGRPYKKALNRNEIVTELKNCSGTQFDPDLVELFLPILEADD